MIKTDGYIHSLNIEDRCVGTVVAGPKLAFTEGAVDFAELAPGLVHVDDLLRIFRGLDRNALMIIGGEATDIRPWLQDAVQANYANEYRYQVEPV